jgi:serine-type D-Ala-D-Ala carboxypeptidase/endopeptidase (penicillin-binding protein 4)
MGRTAYLGLGPPDWNNDRVRRIAVLVALVVAALGAVFPVTARAAQGESLYTRLARALAVPHVSNSSSAAIAIDLSTGEIVFQRNANLALVPASNEKLAVTYAALAAFGPSLRIPTDLFGQGELRDGVWHGDLVLKGYGDPTLSTDDLRYLAREVRAAGIRRVTGRIVGDESYFDSRRVGPGWKSWYYVNESPPLSALTVDRGRYRGIYAPDPALAAATMLRSELRRLHVRVAGAAVKGAADVDAWPLATTLSPPLHAILRFMNRESDNFTSELLLKQLGTLEGLRGTTARGGSIVRRTLGEIGIPMVGVRIADGSGLSRSNRLTARALITLLRIAWEDVELRTPFIESLAVAGRNGTLRDRMRRWPVAGRVLAKTGTTSIASALSGFVNRRFAFVVLQNGRPISHFWARRAQDRFAAVLASAYRPLT